MSSYFELVPRSKFKPRSWQSKSWRYGTEKIDWNVRAKIPGNIKRVVVSYKSYLKEDNGKRITIGKLQTRHMNRFHCIADTQKELSEMISAIQSLEKRSIVMDERYPGKLKNILKCMIIFGDTSTECIVGLDRMHRRFEGIV